MKPTLLFDCDGVLCDFLGGLLAAVNRDRRTAFKPVDCDRWDIGKAYGLEWSYLNTICSRPGFCASLNPLPGAIDAVNHLRELADVYVVTSPFDMAPHWIWERAEWLFNHFGFDKDHVIHCNTKRLIWGDILVDDRAETVVEWCKRWRDSTGLLWDAPYNQGVGRPRNAHRTRVWQNVLALAEHLAAKREVVF